MACLPAWAARHYARWNRQGWREPSATEVMTLFQDYLRVCELCLGTVAEIARAAVAHAPVVDPAQVAQRLGIAGIGQEQHTRHEQERQRRREDPVRRALWGQKGPAR